MADRSVFRYPQRTKESLSAHAPFFASIFFFKFSLIILFKTSTLSGPFLCQLCDVFLVRRPSSQCLNQQLSKPFLLCSRRYPDCASASAFDPLSTCSISYHERSYRRFFILSRYVIMLSSLAWYSPFTWLTMISESQWIYWFFKSTFLAMFYPSMRASYSASLLDVLNWKCSAYLSFSPSGFTKMIPAPDP